VSCSTSSLPRWLLLHSRIELLHWAGASGSQPLPALNWLKLKTAVSCRCWHYWLNANCSASQHCIASHQRNVALYLLHDMAVLTVINCRWCVQNTPIHMLTSALNSGMQCQCGCQPCMPCRQVIVWWHVMVDKGHVGLTLEVLLSFCFLPIAACLAMQFLALWHSSKTSAPSKPSPPSQSTICCRREPSPVGKRKRKVYAFQRS